MGFRSDHLRRAHVGLQNRRRRQESSGKIAPDSRADRITLLQTTVPEYRRVVIEALKLRLGPGFRVVAGSASFEPSITLSIHEPELILIRNVFLAKRRLLWQRGAVFRLLLTDVALLELNPRIISSWSILIMRRMLRRPTVLWGHAWPRRGAGSRSDLLRGLMRRLGSAVVVYTETQAAQLSPLLPGKIVRAAPNALYPERAAVVVVPVRPAPVRPWPRPWRVLL